MWDLIGVFLGTLAAAAAIGAAWGRRRGGAIAVHGLSLGAMLGFGAIAIARLLADAPAATASLPIGLPWIQMHLRLDGLAALFMLVVAIGGALASLYGLGHDRPGAAHGHAPPAGRGGPGARGVDAAPAAGSDPVPRILPFFPAFLAAMVLVLLADDAFAFLVSWEAMSLLSWLLVLANHRQAGQEAEVRRAALVYLAMAAFGTTCLLLAFGLMVAGTTTIGPEGETGLANYGFDAIRSAPPSALVTGLAGVLVLVGCGSKAGLAPLHVWLPLAHPAAPSHVSALMSGAMTKVAVYGLVRILFDLIDGIPGAPMALPWGLAATLMLAGGLTAVLGALHAVLQRDIKKLLAYSTIENIGVIAVGLGLAIAFRAAKLPDAAALALTAALFHALNHALFKTLLFLAAGAILDATGQRDLERLGGLIHRMPMTAAAALVGCGAIAALPPLNGFASEWLLFRSVIGGIALPEPLLKMLIPAVGALLALAAALAAAAMVKAFGSAFLGRARSPAAAAAQDPGPAVAAAIAIPAAACVVLGVVPALALRLVAPVASAVTGGSPAALVPLVDPWLLATPSAAAASGYGGLAVAALLLGLAAAITFALRRSGNTALRRAPTWDCGFPNAAAPYPGAPAQYSAASIAQPLRRVLATLPMRARESVDMPEPGERRAAKIETSLVDPAWSLLFGRIERAVERLTALFDPLRALSIRHYLSMTFATAVAMLLYVVLTRWQG